MKIHLVLSLIVLFVCCEITAFSQSQIFRFEHRNAGNLKYDAPDFLSKGSKNKIVWFGGWHNDLEIEKLPKSSSKKNLLLLPDNKNIASIGEYDDYYKHLKTLNKSLKSQEDNKLLTWPGCAGLDQVKLSKNVILIYVDTEWFFHSGTRAEFSNTKCETLWETDFWASLEDILDDESDKLICVVGHHSIYQESTNPGGFSFLFPFNGPLQDFNSAAYTQLRRKMTKLLEANKNAIYISPNRSLKENKYADKEVFLKNYDYLDLVEKDNGTIVMKINDRVERVLFDNDDTANDEFDVNLKYPYERRGGPDSTVITGAEYKASWMKALWLGGNFRKEWTTPVRLEKLNIQDVSGGLTPYAIGGGLQTLSLKFKDRDGRKFSFRSVNKDAKKNKERIIMQTAVGEVKQDMISSQLPFGDIVVGKLLDNTDILHVNPTPYIMDRQDALGQYIDDFSFVVGTLEEKPTKKNKNRNGFAEADKIVTSHYVLKKMLNNSKHQIDRESFARCIIFDIWIADWDRHHDNWKWAKYDQGKNRLYKPIPRDRDHAFALFEGIIGNVADIAAPNVAELSPKVTDIKGMTFQGKSLVSFLGSSITRAEWNDAARYIQSTFTPDNIEEAWSSLPVEIQQFSKEKIITRLISRLDDLPQASNQLYDLYHKRAVFYGSNKSDQLSIEMKSNEEVIVTLYDSKSDVGEIISQKIYKSDVTKQLEIYTMDGNDDISIKGESYSDIDIILVPGTDKDRVEVFNPNHNIKIVDTQKYAALKSKVLESPIYPDLYGLQYDALLPFAMYKYDTDYRSGFEVQLTKVSQKFNKKPFGRRTSLAAKYYPEGNSIRLRLKSQYTDIWKKWDGMIKVRGAKNDTRYDRFLGTDMELPQNYLRNFRKGDDYYVQNDNVDVSLGMINHIYGQSMIRFAIGSQYVKIQDGTGITAKELLDARDIWQTYAEGHIDLDFTDNQSYPTKGIRYDLSNRLGFNIKANSGLYNNSRASITLVNSWHDITRSILLLKVGGAMTLGNKSYIDFPILGNGNNVRGLANNLIRNSHTSFVNAEIRKEIYQSKNRYVPFLFGASGFFDHGFAFGNSKNSVSGYGGGIYMTFLNNAYSIYLNKGYNTINDESLISYGIGFSL